MNTFVMNRPPEPRTILFDLDDTIIDDSSNVDAAWQIVCAQAATEVDNLNGDALLAAILRVRTQFWNDPKRARIGRLDLRAASRSIVWQALLSLGFDLPDLARTVAESYRDLREAATSLVPGAVETLEAFRARGIRLGLITNGSASAQRRKIERFGLARHFDCILIEGEFGIGKPHERVFTTALTALHADPRTAWMVGDNLDNDIVTPHSLGLYTVWIDRDNRGLPPMAKAQPHRVIRSIAELLKLDV